LQLRSTELPCAPFAHYIRRTFQVTLTAAIVAAAFAPGATWARSHHHHHSDSDTPRFHRRHHRSDDDQPVRHHRRHHHVADTTASSDIAPAEHATKHSEDRSPVVVAGTYAHAAAIRLAALSNRSRNLVDGRVLSQHDVRVLELRQEAEIREDQRRERLIRVAMQDYALHYEGVVDAARSFRGARYVFGGTSRSGFDCSGFVRYILSCRGIDLPRTAEEQFDHGIAVSRDELQPGDLVFFKNTYRHGISHVGIYVGKGNFVHAANSHKGVREDSLDESYYQNHYAGARRVEYR